MKEFQQCIDIITVFETRWCYCPNWEFAYNIFKFKKAFLQALQSKDVKMFFEKYPIETIDKILLIPAQYLGRCGDRPVVVLEDNYIKLLEGCKDDLEIFQKEISI